MLGFYIEPTVCFHIRQPLQHFLTRPTSPTLFQSSLAVRVCAAYDSEARRLHGEKARLNFPDVTQVRVCN